MFQNFQEELEEVVEELSRKVAKLGLEEVGGEDRADVFAEGHNDLEGKSTIGHVRSLVAKLRLQADPIDFTEFFRSQSRREQQYFKDGKRKTSELMKTDVKVGDENLDLL